MTLEEHYVAYMKAEGFILDDHISIGMTKARPAFMAGAAAMAEIFAANPVRVVMNPNPEAATLEADGV